MSPLLTQPAGNPCLFYTRFHPGSGAHIRLVNSSASFEQSDRYRNAIRRFDEENARDPNTETDGGVPCPRELLYARRLTGWVRKLAPAAGEALLLAARCQHLCRWEIPRGDYPLTRAGYLEWRAGLKQFHAREAGGILCEVGYPEDIIACVQSLNLKQNFPADPDSRILEDALCLVFLEFQFAGLAARTDAAKVVNALRKSWKKMTPAGRAAALKLCFGPRETELLRQALAQAEV